MNRWVAAWFLLCLSLEAPSFAKGEEVGSADGRGGADRRD